MGDASSGLVQVRRGRLTAKQYRALKKEIAKCDREIQVLQAGICQAQSNIEMATNLYPGKQSQFIPHAFSRWFEQKAKPEAQRNKLDEHRKAVRAKLKGYV